MQSFWTETPPQRQGPLRLTVEFLVCLVIAVQFYRTWFVEGFIVPSGSMADTLRGNHRAAVCHECGCRFVSGTDVLPLPETAVCPNCGNPFVELATLPDTAGDRLLVQKTAFTQRPPHRYEVVAFRCPDVAHKVYVKRVVGLPGEAVEIRAGDVYINGQLQRKSLEECRRLAVLVYDDRHRPRHEPALPARWLGDTTDSQWRVTPTGYVLAAPSEQRDARTEIEWLTYRHWRRVRGWPDQTEESPVNDDSGYNQSLSRLLNYCSDLGLRCRVTCRGGGELWFSLTDGREQFRLRIDRRRGRIELWQNGHLASEAALDAALFHQPAQLELMLFDRQVLVAVDNRLLLPPFHYESSPAPLQPTSRPLAIGARELKVAVDDLVIVRDVFYTQPLAPVKPWGVGEAYRLAADEYFMLGDNSPLSDDSRMWTTGPGVRAELLVGKPFVVHMPSQAVELGRLRLQFPSPAQVRYIR
ncbi:MAG: signal peptidase I [Pirellulales bacterium]|nr:signal peptidase I [Pirellulales bacterium]